MVPGILLETFAGPFGFCARLAKRVTILSPEGVSMTVDVSFFGSLALFV
jgi:hypothetical protein